MKTILDALGIVRIFLAARGFDEKKAVPERRDGHALLAELSQLTIAMPEDEVWSAIAQVVVRLEYGYQFDGQALIERSLNPWQLHETEYVSRDLPKLQAAIVVARAELQREPIPLVTTH